MSNGGPARRKLRYKILQIKDTNSRRSRQRIKREQQRVTCRAMFGRIRRDYILSGNSSGKPNTDI